MIPALLVSVVLLVYGNVLAFRAVRAAWVVALNLALAAGLVGVARGLGISWHALGLDAGRLGSGLTWGLIAAAVALAGGAIVFVTPLRRVVADVRAVEMRSLPFQYLVRIPLGTALAEEVMFRGVLLALLAREGLELAALLGSSVVFGLWHVGASLDLLRANRPHAGTGAAVMAVVAGVALTAVGGLVFAVLRVAAEGLLAPVLAHAALNAVSLAIARSESDPGRSPGPSAP